VKFALYVPNFGTFSDIHTLTELAVTAEEAGWDGIFLWDHILADEGVPMVDPWIALSAIATATEHIRLGALVTPLPRRRPWDVARATVSLDRLSQGRLIFGAGIGGDGWREYSAFGEDADPRRHGRMLDEALEVLTGLWSGEQFWFAGDHYTVRDARFLPTPYQSPRIPIWIAGMWPRKKPFIRSARYDGVFPLGHQQDMMPDDVRAMLELISEHRDATTPFDVAVNGRVYGPDFTEEPSTVAKYRDAGVTWWLDCFTGDVPAEQVRAHLIQGPPTT
jgi:alkanesulfonate monooxygenase SsuD/methylene tetrahydromethanopterin reductase-like flavin-dependent oxidoreductase (luciferase family)